MFFPLVLAALAPLVRSIPTSNQIVIDASGSGVLGSRNCSAFRSYTALGDSIASGFGADTELNECKPGEPTDTANCTTKHCGKYYGAYTYRFAADYKLLDNFRWPACQGDSIDQVVRDQNPSAGDPALITIHAGADDNSLFGNVAKHCTLVYSDEQQKACNQSIADARDQIGQITGRMKGLINTIYATDRNALIVVMGYFSFWHLPGNEDTLCRWFWGFGGAQNWPVMNTLSAELNSALEAATHSSNVLWAKTDQYFDLHRLCDSFRSTEWFHTPFVYPPPPNPSKDFRFHPTHDGHSAIYRALQEALDCAPPS